MKSFSNDKTESELVNYSNVVVSDDFSLKVMARIGEMNRSGQLEHNKAGFILRWGYVLFGLTIFFPIFLGAGI